MENSEFKDGLVACIFKYEKNEYWAVYLPDDGGKRLVFTRNLRDLVYMEDFNGSSIVDIISSMNKNGFDVEPEGDFDEVLFFDKIPPKSEVFFKQYTKEIITKINFI